MELDKAFKRQVGDLEGLIVCTQTRSILWLAHRNENFLALLGSKNYQKGDGRRIISDMINKNADFMADTKKLFSK